MLAWQGYLQVQAAPCSLAGAESERKCTTHEDIRTGPLWPWKHQVHADLLVRGHGAAAAASSAAGVEQPAVQSGLVAGADVGRQQQQFAGEGQLEVQVF